MKWCCGICAAVIVLDIVARLIHLVPSHPVLSWNLDLYLTTRIYMFENSKYAVMYISFTDA